MLNSNNMALHALANCCKDSIIGTIEKYRVDRQLSLVSASEYLIKEYFWKHFSCYYNVDVLFILLFYLCVLLFSVLYVCLLAYVLVLFCCFGVINK